MKSWVIILTLLAAGPLFVHAQRTDSIRRALPLLRNMRSFQLMTLVHRDSVRVSEPGQLLPLSGPCIINEQKPYRRRIIYR